MPSTPSRADARTGGGEAGGGVGRGDVGIRAQIHVQHRTLRALEQYVGIAAAQLVQLARHVGEQRRDARRHRQLLVQRLLKVERRLPVIVLQHEVVKIEYFAELGGKAVALKQVGNAHSAARHLVLVSRSDAAAGGADGVGAARAFACLIERHVRGQDEWTQG
jgi:hypothetical protein